MELQADILSRLVGWQVANYKGEFMGKIIEIICDSTGVNIQYIILSSDKYFGKKERYFAIPACSKLIKVTRSGKVVLNVNDVDLQLAKRIPVEECPKPIFEFDPSIYELYNYRTASENNNRFDAESEIRHMKTVKM